ncbi:MAG: hypothetical protein FWF10_11940 [Clostridiales bacterium]|nr:hypothetical protein [Clostridiales bacterium]
MERYFVHDFLIGHPVLIDCQRNLLVFYKRNLSGQVYNLNTPECHVIGTQRIEGLIRRITSGDYYKDERVVDAYIRAYLMSDEQRLRCGYPLNRTACDRLIAQTDDFREAITQMCEYVFAHECMETEGRDALLTRLREVYGEYLSQNNEPPLPDKKPRGKETR